MAEKKMPPWLNKKGAPMEDEEKPGKGGKGKPEFPPKKGPPPKTGAKKPTPPKGKKGC